MAYDPQAVEKNLRKPGALPLVTKFRDRLAQVEPFDVPTLETTLQQFVADEQIKIGDVIHALRVAITGKAVGPGLYDCLAILGREKSLARIQATLATRWLAAPRDLGAMPTALSWHVTAIMPAQSRGRGTHPTRLRCRVAANRDMM